MACLLRPLSRDGFEIVILCALPIERDAVKALMDEEYEKDGFSYGKTAGDLNAYYGEKTHCPSPVPTWPRSFTTMMKELFDEVLEHSTIGGVLKYAREEDVTL